MGIWVRSQDKSSLVTCFEAYINDEFYVDKIKKCFSIESNEFLLEKYSSKDKALKVLDMLQDAITGEIECLSFSNKIIRAVDGSRNQNVFIMPQDNEV